MAVTAPLGSGNVTSVVATTATNTVTLPRPSNAVVGDVLIATVSSDYAMPVTTATAGWVRISAARSGSMREVAVFHAFTGGGLPAAPVFTQASNGRIAAAMFRLVGASQTERVLAAGTFAATADSANTVSFVIPATGAANGAGATIAVGYNNATAVQGATTAATFNGAPADLQLNAYGAGSGAPASSSSTNQAVKISLTSAGPFTLAWGKTVANAQGVAVTVPAAGGGPEPEPEPEPVPNAPDVPGLAIQTGPYNVSLATNVEAGVRSVTPPAPENTKVGDILLAVVTHQHSGGITTSPGWLQISQDRPAGSSRALAVYEYRVLTLPVQAPVFTISGAAEGRVAAAILRLTGASTGSTVLDVAGAWPATDSDDHGGGFTIPALTGAAASSLKLTAVYTNSAAGVAPPAVTVSGAAAAAKAVAQAPAAASTALSIFTSTTSAAKAVSFEGSVANGSGFQLALAAYTPPPSASWEARVHTGGGVMQRATLDGVQGTNGAKRNIEVASWAPRVHSVNGLLATTPWFVAHRGSGDNWPEHTMTSYTNAAAFGVKALELSVCTTSDGVMFCHHDLNLLKMTGTPDLVIADMTWAEVQEVYFNTRKWTGEGTPLVHPVKTEDVLNAYAGTHVIFIEDKQGTNATGLLNLMDKYPVDRDRFVWKQYAGAAQWEAAKNRGYKVWGYFMPDTFSRIAELAPRFDILGVPHTASDAVVTEVVQAARALGKPVMCWEVHYRWMLERLLRLGVQGMMTSNIPYVYSTAVAQSDTDLFDTGRRPAGDLPHATDNWALQPRIIPGNPGVLSFNMRQAVGYLMGSMCPIPGDTYTIQFDMRYDGEVAPLGTHHAGMWFGHDTDLTHRSGYAEAVGGYHLIQRGNGTMDLMRHDPETTSGIMLSSVPGPVPVLGQWTTYRVTVSPQLVTAERVGVAGATAETFDTYYRGKYFGFQKNYSTAVDVPFANTEFRNVKWSLSQMT